MGKEKEVITEKEDSIITGMPDKADVSRETVANVSTEEEKKELPEEPKEPEEPEFEIIEMKRIGGGNFFQISKICKKLNLDVKLIIKAFYSMQKNATGKEMTDEENEKIGLDFMELLFKQVWENLYLAQIEIEVLLIQLTGLNKLELNELEFEQYFDLVKRLICDKGFLKLFKF